MSRTNRNANPDLPGYKPPKGSKYGKLGQGSVVSGMRILDEHGPLLLAAVNAVLSAGDAIMFSRTSGGGVLCFALYSNGAAPEKVYATDNDETEELLQNIKAAAADGNAREGP